VRVDQDRCAVGLARREAGQMDLLHRMHRHRVDITPRIEAMVVRTDEDVVDVEQQAAAAAPRHLGDKLPFGHRRIGKLDIRDLAARQPSSALMKPASRRSTSTVLVTECGACRR
jgi:hypothetical protein